MKKYIFAFIFCLFSFLILFYQTLSPVEKVFLNLNRLGDLIKFLGKPQTIQQIDDAHTFFYWTKHGIGVFCHPLYYGQWKLQKQKEWIVTSIIVPLENDIYQRVVKEENPSSIYFKTLIKTDYLFFDPFLYYKTIYSEKGKKQYIQYSKRDWFFDYD